MRDPLLAQLARRTTTVLVGNGASKAVLVAIELYIGAVLGASVLGRFAVLFSLLLVTGMLAGLGSNYAIVRLLGMHKEDGAADRVRSVIQASWLIVLFAGSVAGFAILVGSGFIARHVIHMPELSGALVWVGLAVPFEAFNQTTSAVFRGLRSARDQVLAGDLLRNVVVAAILMSSVRAGRDPGMFGVALFVGVSTGAVYGALRVWLAHLRPISRGQTRGVSLAATTREILAFSSVLFLWNVFQTLAGRIQLLVAALFLDASQVGVLNIFIRFLLVLTFVQSAVNHTAPVEFAKLHHLADHAALDRLFRRVSLALLALALPIAVPVMADPGFFLRLIGSEFAISAMLLVPFLAAQLLDVGTGPMGQLLIAAGHRRPLLGISVVAAVLQIGLAVGLIPRYGLAGAVWAGSATILVVVLLRHLAGWRLLRIRSVGRDFAVLLTVGAACLVLGRVAGASLREIVGISLSAPIALIALLAVQAIQLLRARRPHHASQYCRVTAGDR